MNTEQKKKSSRRTRSQAILDNKINNNEISKKSNLKTPNKRNKKPKKRVKFDISNLPERELTEIIPLEKLTRDGYLDDGFVERDDSDNSYDSDGPDGDEEYDVPEGGEEYFDLDSQLIQNDIIRQMETKGIDKNIAQSVTANAFRGTGKNLIESYLGTKPSVNHWKLGVSPSEIQKIEPEYVKIRKMIDDEAPTIPKILQCNIMMNDKKKCIKLFDQLNNLEPFTADYDQKAEEINNIIRKGNKYSKVQIQQLENIEKSLVSVNDDLKDRILTLNANQNVKNIVYGQYLQMLEHEVGSQAYNALREEIEWSLRLPHNTCCPLNITVGFYAKFLTVLNKKLYRMDNIKMKMLHIVNDMKTSGNAAGRNIAIVGAPGTGKTAISHAFADALGLPFEKISVGGMEDASILKGSDKVWNSASPSIILQILARVKSSRCVILFDEVDKLGETAKGKEVQYALLHITDYIHNKEFRDNYLNKYPHDLSGVLFMFDMNTTDTLDPALLSRLDIIEAHSYNLEDKKIILTDYVLPDILKTVGLSEKAVVFNKETVDKVIGCSNVKNDPGIREMQKVAKAIVEKINMYNSAFVNGKLSIALPYNIPNFKLPLTITGKLLNELI